MPSYRNQSNDKKVLLAKSKLNSVELLISKALIDSNIIHNEFDSINNVVKEYNDMKEDLNNESKILCYFWTNAILFLEV